MSGVDIQEHARKLYEAHGDKAEHEAAQKAAQADLLGFVDHTCARAISRKGLGEAACFFAS